MKRPSGFDGSRKRPLADLSDLVNAGDNPPRTLLFRAKKSDVESKQQAQVAAKAIDLSESVWDADRDVATSVLESGVIGVDEFGTAALKVEHLKAEKSKRADTLKISKKRIKLAREQLRWEKKQQRTKDRKERRRFTVASRRAMRSWLAVFGSLALLAVVVAVLVFTPIMSVQKIEITGLNRVSEDNVAQSMSKLHGTPIALVNDKQIADTLAPYGLIESYQYEILPPGTIRLKVQERVPVVAVKNGTKYDEYDAAGVLVDSAPKLTSGIPLATGEAEKISGAAFASSAVVIKYLPSSVREQIVEVTAKGSEDVSFRLKSGLYVIWGGRSDYSLKALVLERLITALTGKVSVIDVSAPSVPVYR